MRHAALLVVRVAAWCEMRIFLAGARCAGRNGKESANVVRDANGCDMLRCGCEMRMGARCAK